MQITTGRSKPNVVIKSTTTYALNEIVLMLANVPQPNYLNNGI